MHELLVSIVASENVPDHKVVSDHNVSLQKQGSCISGSCISDEECYLNNHLVDNLWDNYNLQRKSGDLYENQSNREIK